MRTELPLDADAAEDRATSSTARHLPAITRVLLGLIFLVMGLNGFLDFLPHPTTPLPAGAGAFLGALVATGYMIALVSGVQVIAAVLLLSNRFVPLALALLAPVIVNIVAFHSFLALSGIGLAILVLVLEVYLAWVYRAAYRPMLAMRAVPGSQ